MAKKIQKKVEITLDEPKSIWQRIKAWFYNAESIMLAWIVGAAGVVTSTVAGILGSSDFTSIFAMLQSGLSFTKQQLVIMGIGAVGMGALQYWARVRGTKEVAGNLLPKSDK